MKSEIIWHDRSDWEVISPPVLRSANRGAASRAMPAPGVPPAFLATDKVRVESVFVAAPKPAATRRGGVAPQLDFSVPLAPGERSVVVLRREFIDPRTGVTSPGAITFHRPDEQTLQPTRRGISAAASSLARFRILIQDQQIVAEPSRAQRGLGSVILKKVIKITVLKVVDAVVDKTLPVLAALWEKNAWKKERLTEGWQRVDRTTLATKRVTPWRPDATTLGAGRSLLFLHGTFSNAGSAFHSLAGSDFFKRVQTLYGNRIFAFDHFTISRTPEENARMLLDALPAGRWNFDVITHSRGGLVLRNLAERAAALGPAAGRFRLGRAVLVASPNEGTPLATPERWERTIGWIANLLELFPENPFTTGASWVSEAIVWLARHASGNLPGIGSMNSAGGLIGELQSPPGPAADSYSALVSNFAPDQAIWRRMLDVGLDGFFGLANDLVVPTAGGWRVDKDGTAYVAPERIGCFGSGGNLNATEPVNHLNFFAQAAAVSFLGDALAGKTHPIPALDPSRLLPNRRGLAAPVLPPEPPPRKSRPRKKLSGPTRKRSARAPRVRTSR